MKLKDLFIPTKRNKYQAYLLKIESIAVITLVVFLLNLFISNLPQSLVQAKMDITSIVYMHNRERAKRALSHLTLNSKLIDSATEKAGIMLENDCWDHYCPSGVSPWETFKKVGYKYSFAGENLAEGFEDYSTMMQAWMNSPSHRENVLKPEFTEVGIGQIEGVFQGNKNNLIVAVHFGHPINQNTNKVVNKEPENPFVFDYSNKIRFYNLESNLVTNNQYFQLKGEVDAEITSLELIINNTDRITIPILDEQYVFNNDLSYKFNEGENEMVVVGYNDELEEVERIEDIRIEIDTITPQVWEEDIEILEIKEGLNNSNKIVFEIPTDSTLDSSVITLRGHEIEGEILGSVARFELDYDISSKIPMVLNIQDHAGNNTEYTEIDTIISNMLENDKDSIDVFINSSENNLESFGSEFSFDFSSLDLKSIFNLLIIAFVATLLIIDYTIIKKYKLIDTHRLGNQHVKLALLLVVGIITLLSSGLGHILTGMSI